jgi:hypothetical protein
MAQVLYNIGYVPQKSQETCWAACLEMWATREKLAYFSQDQYPAGAKEALVWGSMEWTLMFSEILSSDQSIR